MVTSTQLAKQVRDVFFGGNWTDVCLQELLEDITWQQSVSKIYDLNSIAGLTFHINYFINPTKIVLEGGPLVAHDKFSFDVPEIDSEETWNALVERVLKGAEEFALAIELLDDSILLEIFVDEKYGTYYRNISGIIEHTHYHLGQISLIKRILAEN
jgi:hypothetical protein